MILSDVQWQELALQVIGIVDYDIQKECQWAMEDCEEVMLVTEVADFLKEQFGGQDG